MALQTEYEFTLPKGYVDGEGGIHKHGTMRLATAADEILPMKDPRVQANAAYLTVILLSRVITSLGSLDEVNPRIVEGLYIQDLSYLKELYNRINGDGELQLTTTCGNCGAKLKVRVDSPGESSATPSTS